MTSQFKTVGSWTTLSLVALACGSFYSCKESKDSVASMNTASVKVRLLGVENPISINKKGSTQTTSRSGSQSVVIPFTETSSFEATLTSASAPANGISLRAASATKAATVEERTPLDANIKYKVVVYDNNGDYVKEQIYTNTVDNAAELELEAGKTYTFVAYSINSTSTVPTVSNPQSLSAATLEDVSADLMYFKGDLTVQTGTNNLDVVLAHKYSQITTSLSMATDMTGYITNLVNPTITPTYTSADLKLSDGTITQWNLPTASAPVAFPLLGTGLRTVASNPTLLLNPGETNGTFNIGTITIDGETKNNVSFAGLHIVPGQRYNLNLNFKTCTQEVTGGADLNWNYPATNGGATVNGQFRPNGSVVEQTLQAPGADYGFVFDILRLDNSFNMEVNGQPLATQEIQFEATSNSLAPKNVEFEDGSQYAGVNTEGGSNISQIYSLTGTAAAPILRVVISRTGEVKLYGSKVSGGALYPLRLTAGSFNQVNWSPTSNTVKITQIVQGKTEMVGAGSGRKKISCN
ncbi:fimbrillin family protein [Sphingobacterium thalpophilum]|uniref:fimbrillin family protein n=1 Tax=Sphingobacterium thalpophilum TaxID=259 RepID=UPI003DA5203A